MREQYTMLEMSSNPFKNLVSNKGYTDFVSKLNETSREKAKEELHELNDGDRRLAVQTLRKWVLEQTWL